MKFRKYAFIIGILLFFCLIISIDVSRLGGIICSIRVPFLLLGLSLTVVEVVLKAYKLKILMSHFRGFSLRDSLIVVMIGLSMGNVSPAKVGDFIKVAIMQKRSRISLVACIATVIMERLMDLIALFGSASAGIIYMFLFLVNKEEKTLIYFFILLGAGTASLIILMNRNIVLWFVRNILSKLLPVKAGEGMLCSCEQLYDLIREIFKNKPLLIVTIILSIIWIFAMSVRSYFFSIAIGLNISLLAIVVITPIVTAVECIPITILGVGTRDYLIVLCLSFLGINKEESLVLSSLILTFAIIPQITAGFILFNRENSKKG